MHLIVILIQSLLMNLNYQDLRPRALILETEGLVCERLRRMLEEEGIASCLVDRPELFHELRAALAFKYYVVGVRAPEELEAFELTPAVQPLLLLAPLVDGECAGHYRMALPQALLLDRGLRDPNALRSALDTERPQAPMALSENAVRRTFGPFGLSERQLEVLSRALLGESSAQIARELYISDLTVRNHLHAIYESVGVSGRRELLGRFVRGLVEVGHA